MYIETSKEIGSKVYFLKPIRKVKCSLCNGTGHISLGKPLNVEDDYESPSEFVQSLVHQFTENASGMQLSETLSSISVLNVVARVW